MASPFEYCSGLHQARAEVQQLWQAAQATRDGKRLLFDVQTMIERSSNTDAPIQFRLSDTNREIAVEAFLVSDIDCEGKNVLLVGKMPHEEQWFAIARSTFRNTTHQVWTVADRFDNTIGKVRMSNPRAKPAPQKFDSRETQRSAKRRIVEDDYVESDEEHTSTDSDTDSDEFEPGRYGKHGTLAAKAHKEKQDNGAALRRSTRNAGCRKSYVLPRWDAAAVDSGGEDCVPELNFNVVSNEPSAEVLEATQVPLKATRPSCRARATFDRSKPVDAELCQPQDPTPAFTHGTITDPAPRLPHVLLKPPTTIDLDVDGKLSSPAYDPSKVVLVFINQQGIEVDASSLEQFHDVDDLFAFAKVAKLVSPDGARALTARVDGSEESFNMFRGRDDHFEKLVQAVKMNKCWEAKRGAEGEVGECRVEIRKL